MSVMAIFHASNITFCTYPRIRCVDIEIFEQFLTATFTRLKKAKLGIFVFQRLAPRAAAKKWPFSGF